MNSKPTILEAAEGLLHPVDDYFAKRLFAEAELPERLFLAYLLKTARNGHLCIYFENHRIFPSLSEKLDPLLLEGLKKLPQSLFNDALVKEENRIYLRRNWNAEKLFFTHVNRLISQNPETGLDIERLETLLEDEKLLPEQKKAILDSANRSLSIILGGPGTGKTHTAKILLKIFAKDIGSNIAIAAPTGKAVANLREANIQGFKIMTLHSLLKKPLLSEDLILIDESSMIDAEIMSRLFAAIKEGARLILLGDGDQLPPVETGNLFLDLVKLEKNVSKLHTCMRAELSEIIEMARRVKAGNPVPYQPLPEVNDLIDALLKKNEENLRILTPLRKGVYGVENLNRKFYEAYKKKSPKKVPIMILSNDPHLELYNGDTGFFDEEKKCAYFGEKVIKHYRLPKHELCFVQSVHKSQGSEYDEIVLILGHGSEHFGREMLYTAITRAKKSIEIFALSEVIEKILKNKTVRVSGSFLNGFSNH